MEPKSVIVEDKRPSLLKRLLQFKRKHNRIVTVALLLVVLIIIAFVGWRVWADHHKKKSPPSHEVTSSQVSAVPKTASIVKSSSACEATYKDTNLCQFALAAGSFNTSPYKANITVATPGAAGSTLTLLNDGQGNTELTGNSAGSQITSIYLGGIDYLKTGSDTYDSYQFNYANASNPAAGMNISLGGSGLTFKSVGSASCGSLKCLEYSVTKANSSTKQYIWFDTKSYLLRRWEEDQDNSTTNMTITYQPVTVSAPPQSQVDPVW